MLKKILKSYDYTLIIATILLCAFGLVMIYSSSMASAVQRYGYPPDFFYQKQKVWLLIFTVIFLFAAVIPYKIMMFKKVMVLIVLASILSLLGLFVFGVERNNAQSWYPIGTFLFQPSEFVKLAAIIYLAAVYAKKQAYINQFNKGVLPPLVYLFIVCALIIIQPDFGTAAIIIAIACMIVLCSGMNFKSIGKLLILALVVLLPLIISFLGEVFF